MKTVGAHRTYLKGLGVGVTAGLPLAAAFASLLGGKNFSIFGLVTGTPPGPGEMAGAAFGAIAGFALGLVLGFAGAALTIAATSQEARDHLGAPGPVVDDGGVFPGLFGSADPYEPFKRRIDAEEGKEPAQAPPATMPAECPSCGKALDPEDPVAFCYHCGAGLS